MNHNNNLGSNVRYHAATLMNNSTSDDNSPSQSTSSSTVSSSLFNGGGRGGNVAGGSSSGGGGGGGGYVGGGSGIVIGSENNYQQGTNSLNVNSGTTVGGGGQETFVAELPLLSNEVQSGNSGQPNVSALENWLFSENETESVANPSLIRWLSGEDEDALGFEGFLQNVNPNPVEASNPTNELDNVASIGNDNALASLLSNHKRFGMVPESSSINGSNPQSSTLGNNNGLSMNIPSSQGFGSFNAQSSVNPIQDVQSNSSFNFLNPILGGGTGDLPPAKRHIPEGGNGGGLPPAKRHSPGVGVNSSGGSQFPFLDPGLGSSSGRGLFSMQAGPSQSQILNPGPSQSGILNPGPSQSGILNPGQSQILNPGPSLSQILNPGQSQILNPGPSQSQIPNSGPSQSGIFNPGPSQSGILNPGPSLSQILNPGQSQILNPGPSQSQIPNSGPSQSGIFNPGPSQSGILNPGPSLSQILNPGQSQILNPGPSQSQIPNSGPSQSGIFNPGPSQSGIFNPGPSQSGILNPGPSLSQILNPGPSQSQILNPSPSGVLNMHGQQGQGQHIRGQNMQQDQRGPGQIVNPGPSLSQILNPNPSLSQILNPGRSHGVLDMQHGQQGQDIQGQQGPDQQGSGHGLLHMQQGQRSPGQIVNPGPARGLLNMQQGQQSQHVQGQQSTGNGVLNMQKGQRGPGQIVNPGRGSGLLNMQQGQGQSQSQPRVGSGQQFNFRRQDYLPPKKSLPNHGGGSEAAAAISHHKEQQNVFGQLYEAADSVITGNLSNAQGILARLNHLLTPSSVKPYEKSASFFKEALTLAIQNPQPSKVHNSQDTMLKMSANKALNEASLIYQFMHFTANQALLEVFNDSDRIHILDFDIGCGGQWSSFMAELSKRSRGSPRYLKITAFSSPSAHHSVEIAIIHSNLTQFANELGICFELEVVNFDTFDPKSYSVPTGNIAVNFPIWSLIGHLPIIPSLLSFIRRLSPKIVITIERGCERLELQFKDQFLHALKYFELFIDSMDSLNMSPETSQKIDKFIIQPMIESVVSGGLRYPNSVPPWKHLFASAGFKPIVFSPLAEAQGECLIKNNRIRGFSFEKHQGSAPGSGSLVGSGLLMLCWQFRELLSISAWRC